MGLTGPSRAAKPRPAGEAARPARRFGQQARRPAPRLPLHPDSRLLPRPAACQRAGLPSRCRAPGRLAAASGGGGARPAAPHLPPTPSRAQILRPARQRVAGWAAGAAAGAPVRDRRASRPAAAAAGPVQSQASRPGTGYGPGRCCAFGSDGPADRPGSSDSAPFDQWSNRLSARSDCPDGPAAERHSGPCRRTASRPTGVPAWLGACNCAANKEWESKTAAGPRPARRASRPGRVQRWGPALGQQRGRARPSRLPPGRSDRSESVRDPSRAFWPGTAKKPGSYDSRFPHGPVKSAGIGARQL